MLLPASIYFSRQGENSVATVQKAALKLNRNGFRDMMAIRLAYRHGLRCAEVCDLRWNQIDLGAGKIHNDSPAYASPLDGHEIR
jgi:integrase